jgi:hypothetical protein
MKRKFLVIVLAVAILALPLSATYAKKPVTMTLNAIHFVDEGTGDVKHVEAGSGNVLVKIKDSGDDWTGDIMGRASYSGSWLITPSGDFVITSQWIFEEVTILGVGTGGLKLGGISAGNFVSGATKSIVRIESGSGELSGVTGRGTATPLIPMAVYAITLEIQYHP